MMIAVFWTSAHSGLVDRLAGTAADSPYNLLVRGFREGQLSLKKAVPPGLAQLAHQADVDPGHELVRPRRVRPRPRRRICGRLTRR